MITLTLLMFATRQIRSLLSWVRSCAESLTTYHDRREAVRILGGLDDHMLRDIGLSRDQTGRAARDRVPAELGDAAVRHPRSFC